MLWGYRLGGADCGPIFATDSHSDANTFGDAIPIANRSLRDLRTNLALYLYKVAVVPDGPPIPKDGRLGPG